MINFRKSILAPALAAAVVGLTAAGASALTVDGSGVVTDWGVTPFSNVNGQHASSSMSSVVADDYAPINYPGGVGYVPSPGGSLGEKYDLEEMHARVNGDRFEVLVVNSSGFEEGGFQLGDLILTTGGSKFAVVGDGTGRTYAAGDVVDVTDPADVNILQNKSGSYLGHTAVVANDYGPDATVEETTGPWQAKDGLTVSPTISALISTATFDYGGSEDGTHLIEYSIFIPGLADMQSFAYDLHLTWGCGNDVMKLDAVQAPTSTTPVPAPASAGLIVAAMIGLIARRRRG